MVEKIIKMISNLKILSKMNEIIDGLNTHTTNTNNPHNVTAEQLGLATAYVYKGSVINFSDLPTNAQNGWVYSVENEHTDSAGILHPAGANFAWNGSQWDDLGGSLSGYAKSVNSQTPDSKGNVFLNLVQSLEKNTEDKLIVHNADGTTQELELGKNYDNDLNNILDSITELETRVTPVEKGGTGATSASQACANIGALPKTGGAMTGSIKCTTTYSDDSGSTYTSDMITFNTSNTSYGNNIAFGGGGNTVIGAGESYSAQLSALAGNSNENCYICADSSVYIKTNCNTFANAKTYTFTSDGKITFPNGAQFWIA